jgi:23S rRNA pseudouridine2605 synthase
MMAERLQNVLAHAGVASRRGAVPVIAAGRVTVDGVVVREAGFRVGAGAIVAVDGRALAGPERHRTIMLYKPAGVLSTLADPFGGKTVADILRGQVAERLVPVGRLDKDSEGLLLLSNDGDLTLRLTHPRYAHEKTYLVHVAGRWSADKLAVLRSAVTMPDGYVIRPVPVDLLETRDDNVHLLRFRLREGRKRQIRYMCSAAHLVVLSLTRVAVGAVRLPDDLKPGEWRDLSATQLASLTSVAPPPSGAACGTYRRPMEGRV